MSTFSIDPSSPYTVWGQVQRDLRRRIELGEFATGDKLPSEIDLAQEYGVSRATVRRCVQSLIGLGVLQAKRGSGTYVLQETSASRVTVHLQRPWREQLLAAGHVARSRLVRHEPTHEVPTDLLRFVERDRPESLQFGLHLQEVDGRPIAITESWSSTTDDALASGRLNRVPAAASGIIRIGFATLDQAEILGTVEGDALFETITCSRFRETGALAELARTLWVASRVDFGYSRILAAGQIDMYELLAHGAQPTHGNGEGR